MAEGRLFHYRFNPADCYAEIDEMSIEERGRFLTKICRDLVKGESDNNFILGMIEEAKKYIETKKLAGRKGGIAKASSAIAEPSSAIAEPSTPLASSSSSSSSSTVTTKQKKKPLVGLEPDPAVIEVIEYLNGKTGAAFRPETKATTKHITARIKEGATVDDLLDVIDLKCEQWIGDPKMSGYLRPETLFNAEKFQSYSAEVARGPVIPKSKSIYADGLVL